MASGGLWPGRTYARCAWPMRWFPLTAPLGGQSRVESNPRLGFPSARLAEHASVAGFAFHVELLQADSRLNVPFRSTPDLAR
jgi:hypothetical protein